VLARQGNRRLTGTSLLLSPDKDFVRSESGNTKVQVSPDTSAEQRLARPKGVLKLDSHGEAVIEPGFSCVFRATMRAGYG
jgi:hypothetical protein